MNEEEIKVESEIETSEDIFKANPEKMWEVIYVSQGQDVNIIAKVLKRTEKDIIFFGYLKNVLNEIREFKIKEDDIKEVKPMVIDDSIKKGLEKTFINYRRCKSMMSEMDEIRKGVNESLKELGDKRDFSIVQELKRQSAKAEIFRKTIRLLEIENELLSKMFIVA